MTWATAVSDLRTQLSAAATDKLRWRKTLMGIANGTNREFKTFEKRRITPLAGATDPCGVFVNDAAVTATSDDLESGMVTLTTAPLEGDRVTATYYVQWFTDAQLTTYLVNAANFLGLGDDFTVVSGGLKNAAVKYACADAYQELAVRFAEMISEGFRWEDLPVETLKKTQESYLELEKNFRKEAKDLRNDYYDGRQGMSGAPLFVTLSGRVRNVEPK
jgi:hypothetical protein